MRPLPFMRRNWTLLLLLVLALGLRLPQLSGSLWLDEAAQALESARPLSQQLDIIPDFQPPLLHLLLHFSLAFSQSEWWMRLVSALIPGMVTIWATYALGKKLFTTKVGVWATVLLATSSFHIFYSQELRPYSLPAMWAILSWWWIARQNHDAPSPWKWWLVWTLLNMGGWYSSYLYPFVWISQIVYLALTTKGLRRLVVSVGLTGLSFLPWLPTFLKQLSAGQELRVALPGWQDVVSFSQLKTVPLIVVKFIFGVVDVEPSTYFLTATALIMGLTLAIGASMRPRSKLKLNRSHLLLACWLVVPVVVAWLVSFFVPVIQPKRVLFLLPAMYLVIAWFITSSPKVWWGRALGLTLLVINLYGTFQYFSTPLLQREDWRSATQTIASRYPADQTLVMFAFPEPFAPWRWYDNGRFPTASLGYLVTGSDEALTETVKKATQYNYVIIFDYLRDLSDPQHRLQKEIESFGYQSLEILDYPNIGFIRIYGKKDVTVSDSSVTIHSYARGN